MGLKKTFPNMEVKEKEGKALPFQV